MSENDKPKIGNTPEETSNSALWALYTQAPTPHEIVDLPVAQGSKLSLVGELLQIAMVPISVEDTMLCQAEADDYARRVLLKAAPKEGEQNIAFRTIYDNEVTIRVLWRACRVPGSVKLEQKAFPGPKAMRIALTLDQVSVLAHAYVRVERLLSPIRSIMSVEEMDGFLMRLREGGRTAPLDWLSSDLLRDLLLHSVLNPPPSPSPSNSPGSPQGGSGTPPGDEGPSSPGAPEEETPDQGKDLEPSSDSPKEPPPALVLG